MDNALLAMGLKHKDERIVELEAQLDSQNDEMILLNDENYAHRFRIAELEAQVKHLTTSGHDHTTQYWQTRCEELEKAIRVFLEAYDTAEWIPLKTIDGWVDEIDELRKVVDHD